MKILEDMDKCYGCGACYNVCPVDAVKMRYNEEGFLEPQVDENKCISCGKCQKVCIARNEPDRSNSKSPICYALTVEEFLSDSSSGGAFSLLAENIISKKGVVYGAYFDKDHNVRYSKAESLEELEPLKMSKYVQSDTGDSFRSVKKELERGRKVLFVGCPCQIAGLKGFLEKDYNNLIMTDLLCHGMPSSVIFKSHLERMFGLGNITNIEMRNRDGWSSCLHIELQNGEIHHYNNRKEIYGLAFLKNLILKRTCYDCKYSSVPRQGDITIGDMWEAKTLKLGNPYEKKSSLVIINNDKAGSFFEEALHISKRTVSYVNLTDKGIKINQLNKNIDAPSVTEAALDKRNIFFENYRKLPFEEAAWKTFYPSGVGMILYMSNNYGSVATNYALYEAVKSLGFHPIVCDNLVELRGISKSFAENHLQIASKFMEKKDYENANQLFDSFIVGSDQTYRFDSPFVCKNIEAFLMTFAWENKRKIVYAGSFGPKSYDMDEKERKLFSHAFSSMTSVSFREDYAVDMCRTLFHTESEWVIDPVFLIDKEKYVSLAKESKIKKEEPFLFAYIRFASAERIDLIRKQAAMQNLKIIVVCDATNQKEISAKLRMPEIIESVEFVDWLWYYVNADVVITDSFHGTCFSIILEKKFIALRAGTKERFDSLANMFEMKLEEIQIFNNVSELINDPDAVKSPNYEHIKLKLDSEKKRCLTWLKNAFEQTVDSERVLPTDILLNESLLYSDFSRFSGKKM